MLYVGIDLHRKVSQIAAVDGQGGAVLSRRVPSRPMDVLEVFGELPKGEPLEVAFEAWVWGAESPSEVSGGPPRPATIRRCPR
jgi:hypothetical protein